MNRTFQLKTAPAVLGPFRGQLKELLSASGLNEKQAGEVLLAMDEVLANISRHAYAEQEGAFEVDYSDAGGEIQITVKDFGKRFDPTQVPDPELPPTRPGGLGIYFIKTVMDSVDYRFTQEGANVLVLRKVKNKDAAE